MAKTLLNLKLWYRLCSCECSLHSFIAPYTLAYTYCFLVWLKVHKLELSLTPYLDETLINCLLHSWNLMSWYKQNTSWQLVLQLYSSYQKLFLQVSKLEWCWCLKEVSILCLQYNTVNGERFAGLNFCAFCEFWEYRERFPMIFSYR